MQLNATHATKNKHTNISEEAPRKMEGSTPTSIDASLFSPFLLDFSSAGGEIRASVSGSSGAPGSSGWNANICTQKANIQNNLNGKSKTLWKSTGAGYFQIKIL